MSEIYKVDQVSKILNAPKRQVYCLIKERRLLAFKIGRQYRVRQIDLEEFLESSLKREIQNDSLSHKGVRK